jgi:TetR/AcrR family transcriptional repressor of uid operon
MDDVARAAGCARQSIYKHFATKDELLTALFAREVERYLLALEHMLAERRRQRGRPAASDLEEAFAYTLGYLRGHPLVGRILADPQGMLSVLALGGGSVLEAVTRGIGRVLGALADDRALRAVDGVLVGEIFVRLIASFLLLPRLALDPEDDEAVRALFRECVVEGLRSPRLRQSAKRNA